MALYEIAGLTVQMNAAGKTQKQAAPHACPITKAAACGLGFGQVHFPCADRF